MATISARRSNTWQFQLTLFSALYLFRIINGFALQTFFQPDEFFQSLEPAWEWAFGSLSGAWITWEWKEQLRSSLHPLLFSLVYRLADFICTTFNLSGPPRADILVAAPRLLQAAFAALLDLFTWRLASKLYMHSSTAWTALALTVLSPWQWFCSVRTFSNSLEATLTAIALDSFPWAWFWEHKTTEHVDHVAYGHMQLALVAAATACILRPTNVLIWATISACLAFRSGAQFGKTLSLLECAVLCGGAVLAVSAGMDKMFYGEWTFPAFRFVYFNVVQSLAVFYGSNRLDYYFTEGIPLLLTTALPFGLIGLWQSLKALFSTGTQPSFHQQQARSVLAMAVIVSVLALTCISHKEVRFIYPLLPILHVLAAAPVKLFFDPSRLTAQRRKLPLGTPLRSTILAVLLMINLLLAGYVSLYHQRGVLDVIHHLRQTQDACLAAAASWNSTNTPPPGDLTVAFLMPCHSTPWRSHLIHPSIDAWALTCEPPLDLKPSQRETYRDEADRFYDHPRIWLDAHMRSRFTISKDADPTVAWDDLAARKKRKWPARLVAFEQLEKVLVGSQGVLRGSRYRECARFWNSHWHDDWRRRGDVVVYCLEEVGGRV